MTDLEIIIGDLVKRVTTIEGSDLPPSVQIIEVDDELVKSMEMAKQPELAKILNVLHFEYLAIYRKMGKDYICIWEAEE